jgi:hypothetical protein
MRAPDSVLSDANPLGLDVVDHRLVGTLAGVHVKLLEEFVAAMRIAGGRSRSPGTGRRRPRSTVR